MLPKFIDNREKILLIDAETATSLRAALEQEGYDITVCQSPQKAWGYVYPIRPDLIILHLPHLRNDDIPALQECFALADGVPVIIATEAQGIEEFAKKLKRCAPPFLSLPLNGSTARDILNGLESARDKHC